jgi:RHS repeat-associated protein
MLTIKNNAMKHNKIRSFTLFLFILLFTSGTNWAQNIAITGKSLVYQDQVVTYKAIFQEPINNNARVEWNVDPEAGIVTTQNTNPDDGDISITIRWIQPDIDRYSLLSITEAQSLQRGQIQVKGYNPTNTECRIFPELILANYNQLPGLISGVDYCAIDRATGKPYPHEYQWQVADAQQLVWEDIPNENQADYAPPAITEGSKTYRRKTIYIENGKERESYSNYCTLQLRDLDAGELLNRNIEKPRDILMVDYGSRPDLIEWSGAGGDNDFYHYRYTWERSDNNSAWYEIGTGKTYPLNVPSINRRNVRIRRKITCNGKIAYTNILTYSFFFNYPNKENLNYVRINKIFVRGIKYWEEADMLPTGEKVQSTTYYDGLARPVQEVAKDYANKDNIKADLVSFFDYDNMGRQTRQYLPYTSTENPGKYKSNPLTDQPVYYQQKFGETVAYSRVEYDNSPLNRALKSFAPGSKWGGDNKSSTGDIKFNKAEDDLKRWYIDFTPGATPQVIGTIPPGECLKIQGIDEKGIQFIRYIDRDGNMILRKEQLSDNPSAAYNGWICTYYVYDDISHLRYIIQPEAVRIMADPNAGIGWQLNPVLLNEQCFSYQYDKWGRLITKKVPGAGAENIVYDERGRIVFTQDANQFNGVYANGSRQWSFRLYDGLDRMVAEGVVNNDKTRNDLQNDVDQLQHKTIPINITTNSAETITAFNPVAGSPQNCPGCTATQFNTLTYYDGYTYPGRQAFRTDFDFEQVPGAANTIESTAISERINGFATGGKTRVLDGGNRWLASTLYYDEAARPLQAIKTNVTGGDDVTTIRYDFAGRTMAASQLHTNPATPYQNFPVNTKKEIDFLGRVTAIYQAIGFGQVYKKIAAYSYTDMGRLAEKQVGSFMPQGEYEPKPLDTLQYSYNLFGWITGINKDYALNRAVNNQWSHYFGLYLEYDNKNNGFAQGRLDGKISGWQWRSQGDDIQRKYDFDYDNADRLKAARFSQFDPSTGVWNNTKMDFSSFMDYDHNGNLQSLRHYGVVPGKLPLLVDNLKYYYKPNSNQLTNITDQDNGLGTSNGKLGDFNDSNTGTDDYSFDGNGNMTIDKNKKMVAVIPASGGQATTGITYNFMNKPWKIHIEGKGDVEYIYDGDGVKLQKIIKQTGKPNQVFSYIGGFVYLQSGTQVSELQYIQHPEGRIRIITPVGNSNQPNYTGGGTALPGGKQGVYDYFIKDHLGNVRMVLTEEQHRANDICTMEDDRALQEEAQFGNSSNNEVRSTRSRKEQVAPLWSSNPSAKVAMLSAPANKTGPNVLLRIMAGDMLHAKVDYYFKNANCSGPAGNSPLTTLLGGLLSALTDNKAGGLSKTFSNDINSQLSGNTMLGSLLNQQLNNGCLNGAPKAWLNYIFFDEQFNYAGGSMVQVSQSGDGAAPIVVTNVKAPKNGWVYVYLSNESFEPVFFDNFTVTHERGRIIEESHYYPYGLKMAGISSQAQGKLENRYGYNGKELATNEMDDGSGLDWYEYGMREYDAQVGRFFRTDPLTDAYPYWTPYQYAGCEPIVNTDLDGAEPNTVNGWTNGSFLQTAPKAAGSGAGGNIIFSGAVLSKENQAVVDNTVKMMKSNGWNGTANTVTDQYGNTSVRIHIDKNGGDMLDIYFENGQWRYAHTVFGGGKRTVRDGHRVYFNTPTLSKGSNLNDVLPGVIPEPKPEPQEKGSSVMDGLLDWVQGGLDIIGMIPGVGDIVDVVNAGIYVLRGDLSGALISLAAAIPIVGSVAPLAKRFVTGFQKHHIIPTQIYNEFKEALDGIKWWQQHKNNLERLPTPFHGNHPSYSDYVRKRINELIDNRNFNLNEMIKLQDELRKVINKGLNQGADKLNNFFKDGGGFIF